MKRLNDVWFGNKIYQIILRKPFHQASFKLIAPYNLHTTSMSGIDHSIDSKLLPQRRKRVYDVWSKRDQRWIILIIYVVIFPPAIYISITCESNPWRSRKRMEHLFRNISNNINNCITREEALHSAYTLEKCLFFYHIYLHSSIDPFITKQKPFLLLTNYVKRIFRTFYEMIFHLFLHPVHAESLFHKFEQRFV